MNNLKSLKMRSITLVVHALLLLSYVYTQTSPRGFELYHKFYELPQGQLKFFYCEIGGVKDVRVEYQDEDITTQCQDYDRQRNELWRECTVKLGPGQRTEEGIVAYRMATSGSLTVNVDGIERHTICGYKVNATTCLVTVFGRT